MPVLTPALAAVSPPAAGLSMAIAVPQGNVVAMSAGPNPHRQIRQRPAGRRYPTAPQQSVGGLFDAVFAAFGTFLNGLMDPAPTADPRRPEPSADTPKADIETPAEQDEKQKHPRLDIRL